MWFLCWSDIWEYKLSSKAKNDKSAQRSKFDEMMNFLREGDELIVSEFSRLVPSTNEMVSRIKKYTLNIRKIFQLIKGISLILSKHTGNYSRVCW